MLTSRYYTKCVCRVQYHFSVLTQWGATLPSNKKYPPPPTSSGFSVLFCRLYFAATSGVCLIRSGAAVFQKKLQSQFFFEEREGVRARERERGRGPGTPQPLTGREPERDPCRGVGVEASHPAFPRISMSRYGGTSLTHSCSDGHSAQPEGLGTNPSRLAEG